MWLSFMPLVEGSTKLQKLVFQKYITLLDGVYKKELKNIKKFGKRVIFGTIEKKIYVSKIK